MTGFMVRVQGKLQFRAMEIMVPNNWLSLTLVVLNHRFPVTLDLGYCEGDNSLQMTTVDLSCQLSPSNHVVSI